MNPTNDPQSRPSPRQQRRRLIQRPSNLDPSPRSEMVKQYNLAYRENLVRNGIPDRRTLAEAIMQVTIEAAMSPASGDRSKIILRAAADLLKSICDQNGSTIYNTAGIKKRLENVANQLTPTGATRR